MWTRLREQDRPAMRGMLEKSYLDMEMLAGLDRAELVAALSILPDDYKAWIEEQKARKPPTTR